MGLTRKQAARFNRAAKKAGCKEEQIRNFRSVGYTPQIKQMEFHAAARECDEENGPNQIGFGGARGPGKSHASFAQIALDDARRLPGAKILYLRKVGKQAREQFEDLRRAVLKVGKKEEVKHDYDKRTGVVTLWRDSRIILGHFKAESDIDSYLGLEYDVILIEEATTLTPSKYKALRDSNRTSKNFKPRIYSTTNPGNIGHRWYKARFVTPYLAGIQQDTRFIPATIDDNMHINQGYRKTLEENVGWKLRAHRYGDWDIAAGQYYENFSVDRHVIDPVTLRPDWDYWLAMDYGWKHPTVFMLFGRDNDGNVFIIDEHVKGGWLAKNHAIAVKSMVSRWNLSPKLLMAVPAGHDVFNKLEDMTIADRYKTEGIYLEHANNDRVTGAAEVSARLGAEADEKAGQVEVKPSLFIFKNCVNLIETLPVLQHDPKNPDDVLKVDVDEDGDGGDDSYDALRYGLMSRPIIRASTMSALPIDPIAAASRYAF